MAVGGIIKVPIIVISQAIIAAKVCAAAHVHLCILLQDLRSQSQGASGKLAAPELLTVPILLKYPHCLA